MGPVLTSLSANLVSLVVVVGAALVVGFRSGAGAAAWLAVAGILLLFTLALTWLAVIPGLSATTADGAGAFAYPLILLPFISSAFVPTATMPGPVRAFAEHQPVTSIVNAIRDLFTQQPVNDIWIALAWCIGILSCRSNYRPDRSRHLQQAPSSALSGQRPLDGPAQEATPIRDDLRTGTRPERSLHARVEDTTVRPTSAG